ncbi:DsbA family protein [Bifidobacterium cuniculi]|uniref:DSBA oxidoreductase n=1 Tax=Bifidobacterium cuniculi TaxID=1688 RepID=A0A087ANA4_9BIFI|nr:thioredoxin domain-containing protein [Bifidobacterium cuniculi]KFI60254.1 DSBA oxidoreductase [Bifidobacterium cuniculi]
MAAKNNQERRAARQAEREEMERRREAQRAKDRRHQTIIGVVVVAVVAVLVVIAGIAVYRSLHPQAQAQDPAVTQSAQAALQDDSVKPARADEQGGVLISKDGYGKAVKGVPTVGIYMDFMCPGCGQLHRDLDQTLVELVDAGQINLELYLMAFMDSYSTDEYSSRVANAAVYILEHDDDPHHLMSFLERMFSEDVQPEEGNYEATAVSDEEIVEQAKAAGVAEDVADSAITRNYDQWLYALNSYTIGREELRGGKESMSTPTVTINGYYWDRANVMAQQHLDSRQALLEAIGLKDDEVGVAGKLPSIGADGKPLVGDVSTK